MKNNKRIVKTAIRKNYEFGNHVIKEKYLYITVDKKDYILNEDIKIHYVLSEKYVIIDDKKIFLIFE